MSIQFRLDFEIEVISSDEKSNQVQVFLKPNKKRYEEKEVDGKMYLLDKFDNFLIEKEMLFHEMVKQLEGQPINLQKQDIGNIDDYIIERCPEIEKKLSSLVPHQYEFVDKSEEFLSTQQLNTLEFAIVSIDIAGSTKLASSIEHDKYLKIITVFINEMSRIIPKFRGYILKFTGDGLLAYFPAPSLIRMNDLSLDCSLCIRKLVYNCLNPIFDKNNLQKIQIRIVIDSREAAMM